MEIIDIQIDKIKPYDKNAKTHPEDQVQLIANSIKEFGFKTPILVDENFVIIQGHGRRLASISLGLKSVPCVIADDLSKEQVKMLRLADNKVAESEWDLETLDFELDILAESFNIEDFGFDLDVEYSTGDGVESKTLSDKFGIAPFSVLNAREGWWQDRKRGWKQIGIKSEQGRDVGLLSSLNTLAVNSDQGKQQDESIFDPVISELAYRWFSPLDGLVLDPFAGGSVRGIVACKTGRQYIGVDLRQEQVDANKKQADEIMDEHENIPAWICGDSVEIKSHCKDVQADFIFSCPPYADLEVYSDNPKDISNMKYEDFKEAYFEIVKNTCSLLKEDRFACFVVGEVRDKKGNYYNFVGDTIQAFKDAGVLYYDEMILVTPIGAKAMTAEKGFTKTRKIGKTHQNVLVFLKGDAKKATEACGVCEFGEISQDTLED